jgi:hypothetical protein
LSSIRSICRYADVGTDGRFAVVELTVEAADLGVQRAAQRSPSR